MIHIHKSKPLADFSIVPNAVSQNHALTLEARGMLVYLLSLPATWEIRVEQIKAEVRVGTRVVRRVFKELEVAGHMWLQTLAGESGTFRGSRWHVFSDPTENPHRESRFATVGKRHSVKKKETLLKKKRSKEAEETSSGDEGASPQAEEFKAEWKPIKGTKAEKLRRIRPPQHYPSEAEFEEFMTEHCPHAFTARPRLYLQLCESRWHQWMPRAGRWAPIRDWRSYMQVLDIKIANTTATAHSRW